MKLKRCCAASFVTGARFCSVCGTKGTKRVYRFPTYFGGHPRYFVAVGRRRTMPPLHWFLSGAIPEVYRNGGQELTDALHYVPLEELDIED